MPTSAFDVHLRAAQRGDEDAFARLWHDTHPQVLRFLRVLAGDAADDIASETWLQVVRGLGRFRGDETGFRAWVFTIARNKLTDWRRYEGRRPVAALDELELPHDVLAGRDDTAREALDRLGTGAALRTIARLPADQAEVVMLRVVAGLDVATVARLVGKKPGTVRVTCHRALARLHDLMADAGNAATVERTTLLARGVTP